MGILSGVGKAIGSFLGDITGADQTIAAANTAAEAQRQAAIGSVFRPVGMTSRFGTSNFGYETIGGIPRVSSAGYTVSPELQSIQDFLMGYNQQATSPFASSFGTAQDIGTAGSRLFNLGGQFLPAGTTPTQTALEQEYMQKLREASGQFGGMGGPTAAEDALRSRLQQYSSQFLPSGIGPSLTSAEQQYLSGLGAVGGNLLGDYSLAGSPGARAQQARLEGLAGQITPTSYDPNQAAQRYFEQQVGLLEPERQRQEQRLASSVFGRGRAGLNIGDIGQPELFALGRAREEQNAAIAAGSRERARAELGQDIALGTGLGQQALATQRQAELDRLNQIQAGLGLRGQALPVEEAARLRSLQNLQTGLGLLGQELPLDEAARQRQIQNIQLGVGLFGQQLPFEENARTRMLQDISTGTGLFGTGLNLYGQQYSLPTQALAPIQGLLGTIGTIEQLGQQPFQLGLQVGTAGQPGATSAANFLNQAAQTQYQGVQQANLANAQLLSGLVQGAGSAFGRR